MIRAVYQLAESGHVPDSLIRIGIRKLLRHKLDTEYQGGPEAVRKRLIQFTEMLRSSPIAIHTDDANAQHYEVPAEFFEQVLGNHLKYSCCLFRTGNETLNQAETDMLALTAARAGITDGMNILELGCGWGSLTLWMATQFPSARVTAVSNSASQREFILSKASALGLSNLNVITCDMQYFETDDRFDRVVSVEMFEHMRNYPELFRRIATWLKEDGKFFLHIFSHIQTAYVYETEGEDDWMGRHFFTGGIMPADTLPLYYQAHLLIENHWLVNGIHYKKTADQWLRNMDLKRNTILPVMASVYGESEAAKWFHRWRIFFMACSELWGFQNGAEWMVSHYLFRNRLSESP
jgi:cyclopropane-fatty-acyl-phospholipid synthase